MPQIEIVTTDVDGMYGVCRCDETTTIYIGEGTPLLLAHEAALAILTVEERNELRHAFGLGDVGSGDEPSRETLMSTWRAEMTPPCMARRESLWLSKTSGTEVAVKSA